MHRQQRQIAWLIRMFIVGVAVLLVPPFVMVAVAPMVLVLIPVALLAIPFMLGAFQKEGHEAHELGHHHHKSAMHLPTRHATR
jgi:uncharacterized protein involved in cysteine biosynthesis